MKNFALRYPLLFSALLTMALLGLAFGSKALRPIAPVSNVRDLPPDALRQPTEVERALTVLMSFENLFWVLAAVLAVVLARYLGRWEETGFNRPSRWRDLRLLLPRSSSARSPSRAGSGSEARRFSPRRSSAC